MPIDEALPFAAYFCAVRGPGPNIQRANLVSNMPWPNYPADCAVSSGAFGPLQMPVVLVGTRVVANTPAQHLKSSVGGLGGTERKAAKLLFGCTVFEAGLWTPEETLVPIL